MCGAPTSGPNLAKFQDFAENDPIVYLPWIQVPNIENKFQYEFFLQQEGFFLLSIPLGCLDLQFDHSSLPP